MPRYHFNLHDHRFVPDPEESELVDIDAAKRQAIKLAASILSVRPEEFLQAIEWRVKVTNLSGILLFAVGLAMTSAPATCSPAGSR